MIPGTVFAADRCLPAAVFVEGGYNYHTPHDRPDSIAKGDVHRAGSTVADLVRSLLLAIAEGRHRPNGDGEAVFFDFLGLFMVWYPSWVGEHVPTTCCGRVFACLLGFRILNLIRVFECLLQPGLTVVVLQGHLSTAWRSQQHLSAYAPPSTPSETKILSLQ